jgi:4-diphosphocytidyl-2-C-methyl-D-erythritol kinase
MLQFPGIKINIGLYVTQRRADGFHDLATVFYPLPVCDALEIVATDRQESRLFLSGRPIAGAIEDNLVWRAYQLIADAHPDQATPIDIYLHKNIPMGAGLGGGSADAAFMLCMLNAYYQLQLSEERLLELALSLGSDCPFFICNTPRYAAGRGELLAPIALDLSAYSIQLICPKISIATRWAFEQVTPHSAPIDLHRLLPHLPVSAWRQVVANVFEQPVFDAYPVLADIKEQLYEQGALYAAMSGSGSAIFGIFDKGRQPIVRSDIPLDEFYIH